MKLKSLTALLLCAAPVLGFAHNLSLSQMIPSTSISSHGEIFVEGKDIVYKPWSTELLNGKVRVIQVIAGRKSAKKLNADLMSAITQSKFPAEQYQTTTIINQDDAMWGTSSFVKSSAEESKAEFPWSSIVLDESGEVAKAWQLKEESSAIIVLDKSGKILFVQEGKLNQESIDNVISLISTNL